LLSRGWGGKLEESEAFQKSKYYSLVDTLQFSVTPESTFHNLEETEANRKY